jgi:hypothetical protein
MNVFMIGWYDDLINSTLQDAETGLCIVELLCLEMFMIVVGHRETCRVQYLCLG